jgi:hypothetical protein
MAVDFARILMTRFRASLNRSNHRRGRMMAPSSNLSPVIFGVGVPNRLVSHCDSCLA